MTCAVKHLITSGSHFFADGRGKLDWHQRLQLSSTKNIMCTQNSCGGLLVYECALLAPKGPHTMAASCSTNNVDCI